MNLLTNKIHFVIVYLWQTVGRTQAIFMCEWMNSEIFMYDGLAIGLFMYLYTSIHGLLEL